jgi:hypothetical protein
VKTPEPLFLSVDDVVGFHADQIRMFGGAEGVRDKGSLESAVAMAQAAFGGQYLHEGIFEMAAAYAFHIAGEPALRRWQQASSPERRHHVPWTQWSARRRSR